MGFLIGASLVIGIIVLVVSLFAGVVSSSVNFFFAFPETLWVLGGFITLIVLLCVTNKVIGKSSYHYTHKQKKELEEAAKLDDANQMHNAEIEARNTGLNRNFSATDAEAMGLKAKKRALELEIELMELLEPRYCKQDVVDYLIGVLENGQAETLNDALRLYEETLAIRS